MAAFYKATGSKIGVTPGSGPGIYTSNPAWKANTVYGAGAIVVNGPFAFRTAAGGTSSAVANASGPVPGVLADGTVTWVLIGAIGGLYDVDTEQKHELGTLADVKDNGPDDLGAGEVEYVKFTGTVVAGDFVVINRFAKTCVQISTATFVAGVPARVGIAMCSATTGQFGWVMVRGVHDTANMATGGTGAPNGLIQTTGVAGQATFTVTAAAATNIQGALGRRAAVANVGVAELFYPVHTGV